MVPSRTVLLTALVVLAPRLGAAPQRSQLPESTRRSLTLDCNGNGVPDPMDLASGTSEDCNLNAVPDECETRSALLLSESFEQGVPAGWTFGGSWHVTDQCAPASSCDGVSFAYFGVDGACDFNYSTLDGSLILPEITPPPGATSLELFYCSAYQGEGMEPYDAADVFVNDVQVEHVSPFEQLDWETRRVDLTPFLGGSITVRFQFRAMDSANNFGLGWQVDNVRIVAFGTEPPLRDCNQNGVPDECDPDCNLNGLPDECDIAFEASGDCNLNGVPDECDLAALSSEDCNGNGVPDECDLTHSLKGFLDNMQTAHPVVTSFFPDGYDFSEGDSGSCIVNGGLDMYACGNTLNTNVALEIPYSGGQGNGTPLFGPGSSFATAKYDGLFVLAAAGCNIFQFFVAGLAGNDGAGITDTIETSITVGGQPYQIYVKRIYDAPTPSINQIVVFPGDGTGIVYGTLQDPERCNQAVTGLGGADHLLYAVVSRWSGTVGLPLRHVDAREIARELVENLPLPLSADADLDGIPDECK